MQRFSIPPAALAPLGAVAIWSGNTIVTKAAAVAIDPASIAFYRWVVAFAVLLPFAGRAVWQARAVVWQHWPKLALLGALGMGAYQGVAYVAARTTSAANMGVILALSPLVSALLASLLAGERLSWRKLLGAVVSLAGLVFMVSHGRPETIWQSGIRLGDGLMLAAVSANALYSILFKRWAVPLPTWQQLLVQIGFGVLVLLPFYLAGPMAPVTAKNLPLVLYAGIPASLGAPFFWMTGVRYLGAARASLFLNLLPPVVAILAWLLLGEEMQGYHLIGGAVALLGVGVALWQRPRGGFFARGIQQQVQN